MNARHCLVLSLALNVALGTVIAWAALARHAGPAPFSVAQQLTNRTLRVRRVVKESAPVTVEVTVPFHWSEVESTDYRVYMANLRALGCPERTIRDLIVADVDQVFIERLRQLLAPMQREVWQLLAKFDKLEDESKHYEESWKALKEERAAVFKELLGRDDPFETDQKEDRAAAEHAQWAQRLDFLPSEKQEQVMALRARFEEANRQLWESDHQLSKQEHEERRQKQRELEAERDRQLAELLTPEELAEYRLRNSPGVDGVRRMTRVEFAEDEIRTIAGASAARQQAEAKLGQNTPEAKKQREELAQRTDAELKAALGEARFADYQRSSDNRFEQISAVVERYGLPEEQALAVYDLRREADAQADVIRKDESRSADERKALALAISAETERAATAILGEKAFATLRERDAGWTVQLLPPGK